jgi:hypothetical protein
VVDFFWIVYRCVCGAVLVMGDGGEGEGKGMRLIALVDGWIGWLHA